MNHVSYIDGVCGYWQALYERALRDTREAALARIEAARRKRLGEKVSRAAKFTQAMKQLLLYC